MQHLPIDTVARRVTRQVACMTCYQRPPGSESLGPDVARACEGTCPLFFHLPTLVRLAVEVGDTPGDWEATVKQSVCQGCGLRPTSGEYCADYESRACPMSRYAGDVLAALEVAERVHSVG